MSHLRIIYQDRQHLGSCDINNITIWKSGENQYKYESYLSSAHCGCRLESSVKTFYFTAPADCNQQVLLQHATDPSNMVDELMKL